MRLPSVQVRDLENGRSKLRALQGGLSPIDRKSSGLRAGIGTRSCLPSLPLFHTRLSGPVRARRRKHPDAQLFWLASWRKEAQEGESRRARVLDRRDGLSTCTNAAQATLGGSVQPRMASLSQSD
jgi:hypothetical protein